MCQHKILINIIETRGGNLSIPSRHRTAAPLFCAYLTLLFIVNTKCTNTYDPYTGWSTGFPRELNAGKRENTLVHSAHIVFIYYTLN